MATILASSHLGFALSTTQVASGSIIGSGLGRDPRGVRWGIAGRIGIAWLITLPAAAGMAALAELLARFGLVGILLDAGIAALAIAGMFLWSRRTRVGHHNVTRHPVPVSARRSRVDAP